MPMRYPIEVGVKAVRLALDRLDEYGSPHVAAYAIGPMAYAHPETLRVWIAKAFQQGAPPAAAAGELAATERAELDQPRRENKSLFM